MIKKTKGFTLIETILVVGIILVIALGVYSVYSKKYNNFLVERQSQYIVQIITLLNKEFQILSDDSANVGTSVAAINSAVNPPTVLITNNIIPNEMKASTSTVKNLWGGSVIFSGVNVSGVALFQIVLNSIPQEACSKLITNPKFTNISQKLLVNGVQIKAMGASVADVILATNNCTSSSSNSITITSSITKNGGEPIRTSGALGAIRTKSIFNKYNIAPAITGVTTLAGASCTGGATLNAISKTCECPVNQSWNGFSCLAYVTGASNTLASINGRAGNCRLGEGWNSKKLTCEALSFGGTVSYPMPAASRPTSRILTNDQSPAISVLTIAPGAAITGTTVAGSEVPNNIYTAITNASTINNLAQRTTTNLNGCSVGPKPTLAKQGLPTSVQSTVLSAPYFYGNFDSKSCQICIVGTWNGDRCVP